MNSRLSELYNYLTIKNNVMNIQTLEKFLTNTGHKNVLANIIEILHECDLAKIDLYPLIKICLDNPSLSDSDFTLLYHTLANNAMEYLSYPTILLINKYIKDHPSLLKDKLLLTPIDNNGFFNIDLNLMDPYGHVSYLLDINDIDNVKKNISVIRNRNNSTPPSVLFKRYAKTDGDIYIDILLNILEKYPNVTIAGGFPLMILSGTDPMRTDLDIFIFGPNREEIFKKIIDEMQTRIPFPMYHQIKDSVVNFWFEGTWIRPQIILSPADNIFDLLFNFDLSYSCICYTPNKATFEGTLEGLYAIKTLTTFVNTESIRPNRLLKAYYKNFRVIKYQRFVLADNSDGLEIFTESGLSKNNLIKIMSYDKFRYDYLIPNPRYNTAKNLYDLRTYYNDKEIASDLIDLKKIKFEGISMDNYAHQGSHGDSYRFINKLNKISSDVSFTLVHALNNQKNMWKLNTDYRKQTPVVSINRMIWDQISGPPKLRYIDVHIKDTAFLSELDLIINKATDKFGKSITIPKKREEYDRLGDPLKEAITYFRFKIKDNFKIYDINHNEIYNDKNPTINTDFDYIKNLQSEEAILTIDYIQLYEDTLKATRILSNSTSLAIVLSSIQLFD